MDSPPSSGVDKGPSIGGVREDLKTEKEIKKSTTIQSSPHCVTPTDVKNLPCERNNEDKIQSSHVEGFTNQDKLTIQDKDPDEFKELVDTYAAKHPLNKY